MEKDLESAQPDVGSATHDCADTVSLCLDKQILGNRLRDLRGSSQQKDTTEGKI